MKNHFLFYFIIQSLTSTLSFSAVSPSIIQIPLFQYVGIKYIMGEGQKTKIVPLNLKHNYTSLRLKDFPKDYTPQLIENPSKHYRDITSCIFLSQNETFPVNHIFISESPDGIGFSHLFENYNFSFLHQLKQSGTIPRTSITFRLYRNEPDKGSIFLGGIPQDIITKQMKKVMLPAIKDIKNWSFKAEFLRIGNSTFPLDDLIHFSLDNGSNIVNLQIYNWIKGLLFKDHLKKKKCNERIWENNEGANIICNKEIIDALPTFDVVLNGGNVISIKIDLRDDGKFLNIAYNEGVNDNNRIYIQRGLFYGNLVEFDYDKDAIVVYSENIVLNDNNINNNIYNNNKEKAFQIKKTLFTFNIFIFITCGVYLVFHWRKLHKGIH